MFIERVAKYSSSLQRSEPDLVPFPEALRVVAWTKLGPALVPDALTLLRLQDYWRRGNRICQARGWSTISPFPRDCP